MKIRLLFSIALFSFFACSDGDENPTPSNSTDLKFSFHFDANQPRLDNIGLPAEIPAGNAAQTPEFREMSLHYIELAPSAFTLLGDGAIVYQVEETNAGGEKAVDFDQAATGGDGEVVTQLSLKDVPPGTYEWVRVSVTYQNYDVKFNLKNVPVVGDLDNQSGTIASFVGLNTYITEITPRSRTLTVNDDKKQGFWAFETDLTSPYDIYNDLLSGESAGTTTVVNPLADTSPIPPGSCVVMGKFATPLVITGDETEDVEVVLSFSINDSFEWEDPNGNGELDMYVDDPSQSEKVVDMGLRGLIPSF